MHGGQTTVFFFLRYMKRESIVLHTLPLILSPKCTEQMEGGTSNWWRLIIAR
jgi:hypothetical protein